MLTALAAKRPAPEPPESIPPQERCLLDEASAESLMREWHALVGGAEAMVSAMKAGGWVSGGGTAQAAAGGGDGSTTSLSAARQQLSQLGAVLEVAMQQQRQQKQEREGGLAPVPEQLPTQQSAVSAASDSDPGSRAAATTEAGVSSSSGVFLSIGGASDTSSMAGGLSTGGWGVPASEAASAALPPPPVTKRRRPSITGGSGGGTREGSMDGTPGSSTIHSPTAAAAGQAAVAADKPRRLSLQVAQALGVPQGCNAMMMLSGSSEAGGAAEEDDPVAAAVRYLRALAAVVQEGQLMTASWKESQAELARVRQQRAAEAGGEGTKVDVADASSSTAAEAAELGAAVVAAAPEATAPSSSAAVVVALLAQLGAKLQLVSESQWANGEAVAGAMAEQAAQQQARAAERAGRRHDLELRIERLLAASSSSVGVEQPADLTRQQDELQNLQTALHELKEEEAQHARQDAAGLEQLEQQVRDSAPWDSGLAEVRQQLLQLEQLVAAEVSQQQALEARNGSEAAGASSLSSSSELSARLQEMQQLAQQLESKAAGQRAAALQLLQQRRAGRQADASAADETLQAAEAHAAGLIAAADASGHQSAVLAPSPVAFQASLRAIASALEQHAAQASLQESAARDQAEAQVQLQEDDAAGTSQQLLALRSRAESALAKTSQYHKCPVCISKAATTSIAEVQQLSVWMLELQRQLRRSQQQVARQLQQLKMLERDRTADDASASAAEAAARKLQIELIGTRLQLVELSKSRDALDATLKEARDERDAALGLAEATAAAARGEHEGATAETEALRSQVQKLQERLEAEQAAAKKIADQLATSKNAMTALQQQIMQQALVAEAAAKARAERPRHAVQTDLSALNPALRRAAVGQQLGPEQRAEAGLTRARVAQTDDELWTRGKVKERGVQTDPSLIGWLFRNMRGKAREAAAHEALSVSLDAGVAGGAPGGSGSPGAARAAARLRAAASASAPGSLPSLQQPSSKASGKSAPAGGAQRNSPPPAGAAAGGG